MSMIHVTKTQDHRYLIVDNTASESGFGSGSAVQSEQELRSILTNKRVNREEIDGYLMQLGEVGDISISLR